MTLRKLAAVLVAGVLAMVCLAACGGSSPTAGQIFGTAAPQKSSFGKFAGYQWQGPVDSASASWTVPKIAADSHLGVSGTWIGAQTTLVRTSPAPFIQIGVNEARLKLPRYGVRSVYFAFWSSTSKAFHPQPLFPVAPGDRIAASLQLKHRRWHLALRDTTSGRHFTLTTSDEASYAFNIAEWTQEDVSTSASGTAAPYPKLAQVPFSRVLVDGSVPSTSVIVPTWMSAGTSTLAPGPLVRDAFDVRQVHPNATEVAYRMITSRVTAIGAQFETDLLGSRAATAVALTVRASRIYRAAQEKAIAAFSRQRWPAELAPRVKAVVVNVGALVHFLKLLPGFGTANLKALQLRYMALTNASAPAAEALARQLFVQSRAS